MKNIIVYNLLIIISLVIASGCLPDPTNKYLPTSVEISNESPASINEINTVQITREATPEPNPTYPKITLSAQLTPAVPADYTKIIFGEIRGFDWLPPGEILCYRIINDGKTETWGYELFTGTYNQLDTCTTSRNMPWYDSYIGLPEGAYGQSVSPSGEQVVFLMHKYPAPTTTPDAWGGGESENSYIGSMIDVWNLEKNEARLIGKMRNCPYEYKWSRDEETLLAIVIQGYGSCDDLLFNIIHLRGEIQQVYFGMIDNNDVFFHEVSDNGKELLYDKGGKLYILDLDNLVSEKVDIPDYQFSNSYWINDVNLLVLYKNEGETEFSLGIVNLTKKELNGIFSAGKYPLDQGQELYQVKLSPDHHWLAFTTWFNNNYASLTLRIIKITVYKN